MISNWRITASCVLRSSRNCVAFKPSIYAAIRPQESTMSASRSFGSRDIDKISLNRLQKSLSTSSPRKQINLCLQPVLQSRLQSHKDIKRGWLRKLDEKIPIALRAVWIYCARPKQPGTLYLEVRPFIAQHWDSPTGSCGWVHLISECNASCSRPHDFPDSSFQASAVQNVAAEASKRRVFNPLQKIHRPRHAAGDRPHRPSSSR